MDIRKYVITFLKCLGIFLGYKAVVNLFTAILYFIVLCSAFGVTAIFEDTISDSDESVLKSSGGWSARGFTITLYRNHVLTGASYGIPYLLLSLYLLRGGKLILRFARLGPVTTNEAPTPEEKTNSPPAQSA